MSVKGALTVVSLALGLLVSPFKVGDGQLGIGAQPVQAEKECKLEIEICQEIDLVVYKTRACWRAKFFCD